MTRAKNFGDPSTEPPNPEPGDTFADSAVRHGTPSGYNKHQKAGEEPCETCRMAKAHYDWRWRNSTDAAKRTRLLSKAQTMAKNKLTRQHQEEYYKYYDLAVQELFKDSGMPVPKTRPKGRKSNTSHQEES